MVLQHTTWEPKINFSSNILLRIKDFVFLNKWSSDFAFFLVKKAKLGLHFELCPDPKGLGASPESYWVRSMAQNQRPSKGRIARKFSLLTEVVGRAMKKRSREKK